MVSALRHALATVFAAAREPVLDALAVLMPVDCAGCGACDRALCASCRAGLAVRLEHRTLDDGTVVFIALSYDGPARRSILALKRDGRTDVARALAAPLASAVRAALSATSHQAVELATVPASRRAFRRRGYDPTRLMLRRAGLRAASTLVWVRHHDQQKTLGADARRVNLAWTMRARGDLSGRSFILVDDVVTTGATMLEAARAIRAGGGEVLSAVAVANTQRLLADFPASRRKLVTSPDDGATVGKRGALVTPGSAGGAASR